METDVETVGWLGDGGLAWRLVWRWWAGVETVGWRGDGGLVCTVETEGWVEAVGWCGDGGLVETVDWRGDGGLAWRRWLAW